MLKGKTWLICINASCLNDCRIEGGLRNEAGNVDWVHSIKSLVSSYKKLGP